MPELTKQRAQRPSTNRTLVVLLLVFVFCVSAMAAGGVFDEKVDPSEASTQIISGDEAARIAQDDLTPDQSEKSAPIALIAALLLVAGALLISLAVPTPAEKRRAAAGEDPKATRTGTRKKPIVEPEPAKAKRGKQKAGPELPVEPPRRMPAPELPVVHHPMFQPASMTDETMYLQPLLSPAPVPVAIDPPTVLLSPLVFTAPAPVPELRRVGARGRTPVGPA